MVCKERSQQTLDKYHVFEKYIPPPSKLAKIMLFISRSENNHRTSDNQYFDGPLSITELKAI